MKRIFLLSALYCLLISCDRDLENSQLEHKNLSSLEVRSSLLDFDNSCSLNVNPILGDCFTPLVLNDSIEINGCYFIYSYRIRQCIIKTVPLTYLFQVEAYNFISISGENCQGIINQLIFYLTTNQYDKVKEFLDSIDNMIQQKIENNFVQVIQSEFQQILPSCTGNTSPAIETEFSRENCFNWNIVENLPYKEKCGQSCCIKLIRYCLNEESEIIGQDLGSTEIGSCLDEDKCEVLCR